MNRTNMINLEPWVSFLKREFTEPNYEDFNQSEDEMIYIMINIMNYFTTEMINSTLSKYCKTSNLLDEYIPRINMKNEYLYMKMGLSKVKKRYFGSMRLKEGKEILPEKLDVKGLLNKPTMLVMAYVNLL